MGIPSHRRMRRTACITLKVERLLDRYPNLGEDELAELIESVPFLPTLDYALMLADSRMGPKFESLHNHGAEPGASLSTSISLLAVVVIPLGLAWALAAAFQT